MENVQALLEQLQQLKADNEQLQDAVLDAVPDPVPGSAAAQPNLASVNEVRNVHVYAPHEHKCARFSPKLSVDLQMIKHWVEEVRRCREICPVSRTEEVMFLTDHFDGSAKAEAHFHPSTNRDTLEKIFALAIAVL